MSRYKSEQTAYNPLKKKYVPLWKLDTNNVTVTYFNADTQTEIIVYTVPPEPSARSVRATLPLDESHFHGS